MKRLRFSYKKKGNGEEKEYDVVVSGSGPDYLNGFDLNKLSEEEQKELIEIQKEYERKIQPYIKIAYRQFLKENVIENIEQEIITD